jgi:hypothetical protein
MVGIGWTTAPMEDSAMIRLTSTFRAVWIMMAVWLAVGG